MRLKQVGRRALGRVPANPFQRSDIWRRRLLLNGQRLE